MKRLWAIGWLSMLTIGLSWLAVKAADEPAGPTTIVEVRVAGNLQMSDGSILAMLKSRVGQPYSEDVARDDQRRMLQTGKFENVVIVKTQTDKGVLVVFTVKERRAVKALLFRGNKHFSAKALRKELAFGAGDALDLSRIARGREAIDTLYKDAGFYFAAVSIDPEALNLRQQVIYRIVQGPRVFVDTIRFRFVKGKSFGSWTLLRKVKTSRGWWILTWGELDPQQLARDVAELRNFYRGEGYLEAEVARKLTFNADKSAVDVEFIIDEGPRYRVAETRFEGNSIFADEELRSRLTMTKGELYKSLSQQRDADAIRDAYGQIGHMKASVTPQPIYLPPDQMDASGETAPIVVTYRIEERDQYRVGRITIRGNDITLDRVIRRQLRTFPEQIYDTVAIRESRQALVESRLFERATITPYGDAPGVRDILVEIEEGRTSEFVVGAGFSTNSGLLGTFRFTQRNFNIANFPGSWGELFSGRAMRGGGQTLTLHLEPGTDIFRARLDWREPYLFDRPIALGAGIYAFTRGREHYDESRFGVQTSLGKRFDNGWYAEGAVRAENVKIDAFSSSTPPEIADDGGARDCLLGFKASLVRDRTDSRWLPSDGDRMNFSYEEVIGSHGFGKVAAGYTKYWTLMLDPLDRKHILAARLRGATVVGGYAPVYERYFGGGIGDVRGFEYRGISPRSATSDDPIGGDFKAYAGLEYSYPIVGENLRGVVFLDSGTVERSCGVNGWRVSAGMGLRITIPYMGPVPMALDFGFPLNEEEEDDTQLFSFSFGWVF